MSSNLENNFSSYVMVARLSDFTKWLLPSYTESSGD